MRTVLGRLAAVLPYIYASAAVVVVWQLAIVVTGAHEALLPSPWLTAQAFAELVVTGELFLHAGMSVMRVLSAWMIAATVAIPIGLAMGRFRPFEKVLDPVIELFRPISALAWIPLAILWFGIGESGKIFIIFIATFFPTVLNTVVGVKDVDPVMIRAGQVLGCKDEASIFRKIILPAALPNIVVGLRISFGTGWTAIIAAELVAAQSGLGYLIADGMEILRADLVLVGMVVIGVLGVLFDTVFRLVHRRIGLEPGMSEAAAKGLRIEGITKTYVTRSGETVEALLPMDMEIGPGEFVSLVGPSGCGKSTVLNMLAGFITPSAGIARVGEDPILKPDIQRGMVFQDYALFPWLSVSENVEFGLERQRVNKRERRATALQYLRTVGLQDFADKRTEELSGGMKQRVAIARAFAPDPSIILMDEPFGALDALTRRFLQQQLLRLWQEHKKTIVFVTHSVQEAIYLSDRIVVMTARPGRIKTIIEIFLPHPRDFRSDSFREHERRIFDQLDEELTKSLNLEVQDLSDA